MKILYAVIADDGLTTEIRGIFPTKESANDFVEYCKHWRERFEKEFGVSYNRVEYFTNEMQTWVYNEYSDDCCILAVKEVVYYEDGFNVA